MDIAQLEALEAFFDRQGVGWEPLERKERLAIVSQWVGIYRNAFDRGMRFREGDKARYALSQMPGGDFAVFSATNELPCLRSSENPPQWAYRCRATTIPDLSPFHILDFAMSPLDFSWTMIYTHEDDVWYGPCFAERGWVLGEGASGRPEGGLRRGRRRRR